jgi:hypothetical protein
MNQPQFANELAPRLGKHTVHQAELSRWERGAGDNEPRVTLLLAALEVAGGSVDTLMEQARNDVAASRKARGRQQLEKRLEQKPGSARPERGRNVRISNEDGA